MRPDVRCNYRGRGGTHLRSVRGTARLFDGGPDAVDVVVVFEGLQEIAHFDAVRLGQFRETLGDVADFAGDDRPTVLSQPLRDGMHGGAVGDEPRARSALRDVVVLLVGEQFQASFAPASMAAVSRSVAGSG